MFHSPSTGTSIAFHTFNGVRHLAWDAGYGFAIKDLYKSGYAVLGTSTWCPLI